jgi:hypothetical protein
LIHIRRRSPTFQEEGEYEWASYKQQRRSFVLAGVIGASFAIRGFLGHGYWLAAAGTVILIGALLQLYRTMPYDAG